LQKYYYNRFVRFAFFFYRFGGQKRFTRSSPVSIHQRRQPVGQRFGQAPFFHFPHPVTGRSSRFVHAA
jgi:hypothetical protein